MSRWLVLGAGGMLGTDLCDVLSAEPDLTLRAATRAEVDLLDESAVRAAVAGQDVVVNAAAWTDVDGAETEPERAMAVNGAALAGLTAACRAARARLLHLSTDYVFAGDADAPYPEDAPTVALNRYGASKLRGERHVLRDLPETGYVVRTAWLYGEHGPNFVATMLRLATERDTIDVVVDQRGQPTWARALARQLASLGRAALLGRASAGVYHGTAAGETTWFGFARAIFELAGLDPARIRPVPSDAFPRLARRPSYSVLGHARWARAGLAPMGHWRAALAQALARPGFARRASAAPSGRGPS